MRKLIYQAIGLTCAVLTTSSILCGAAAQAQTGELVLSRHTEGGGTDWRFFSSDDNIEGEGGDEASSVGNGSDEAWVLYQHDTFRGRRYCIRPGEVVTNLHRSQWNFGDTVSSVRRLNSTSCDGFPAFFG